MAECNGSISHSSRLKTLTCQKYLKKFRFDLYLRMIRPTSRTFSYGTYASKDKAKRDKRVPARKVRQVKFRCFVDHLNVSLR